MKKFLLYRLKTTILGITNQCRARYFVDFSANIAVPTGGTAGAISLAIAISGEPVLSSQMISTPAAVDQYNNVSSGIYIDVPAGCCVNIAVMIFSLMGEDERNDSLFIFDEHKNSYIPVTRNQIFVDDISPDISVEDLLPFDGKALSITVNIRKIPPEIRRMILGRRADNNWRKLHGLPMRRRYLK